MLATADPALDRTHMRGRIPEPRTTPLGIWLSEARAARGWTLRRTAEAAGLSHVRVSQIENGVTGDIPRETIRRLARALYAGETNDQDWHRFESAALSAAGFKTDAPEPARPSFPGLPENFDDWPEELKRALAYSGQLSPRAQEYVYKLWMEQAEAHAKIAEELDRMRTELNVLKSTKNAE